MENVHKQLCVTANPDTVSLERNKQQDKPGMEFNLTPELANFYSKSGQDSSALAFNGISMKLGGKSVLVTGGNTGKGRSVAILLALEGARVAIAYLDTEEEDACSTKALVEGMGSKLLLVPIDSTRAIDCKDIAERSAKILGKIDIFYNRFAFMRGQVEALDLTEAQWGSAFRTNLNPYQHLTKFMMPHMSTGSSIINSASLDSYLGIQSKASQPKSALEAVTAIRLLSISEAKSRGSDLAHKFIR